MPDDWRIAKLSGKSKYVTGEAKLSDQQIQYIGDILEALGGFVTWETAESRYFCAKQSISEHQAKSFMSLIFSCVQAASLLVGRCDSKEWHETVNFVLHASYEWSPAQHLFTGPAALNDVVDLTQPA